MQHPKITSFFLVRAGVAARFLLSTFCFLLLLAGRAAGQEEIRFRQYTEEDGLAGNYVTGIIQDKRGWLWIACAGGLTRYDGHQFRIYKNMPDDPNSLSADYVHSMVEDRDGNIWLATITGGLSMYSPEKDQFTNYPSKSQNPNGISSTYANCVFQDSQDWIWIGTENGINRLNPGAGRIEKFEDKNTWGELAGAEAQDIIEDKAGYIWIATENHGLFRLDPGTEDITNFRHIPEEPHSLSNDQLWSLLEDQDGYIWIGTIRNGINRYDPATEQFEVFYPDQKNKYGPVTRDIFQDQKGILWFGTSYGLFRFEAGTGRFIRYVPESRISVEDSPNAVWSITQDEEGTYWIGTRDGGIFSFEYEEPNYAYHPYGPRNKFGLDGKWIRNLYKDREGIYWLGTSNGLVRFDPATEEAKTYFPNAGYQKPLFGNKNGIGPILEDSRNDLWIGTNLGLKRFDRKTETFFHYWHDPEDPTTIGENDIRAIYEDRSGRIWIGIYDGGLNRYNPDTDDFTRFLYDPNAPLPDQTIGSILEDRANEFWIGTVNVPA